MRRSRVVSPLQTYSDFEDAKPLILGMALEHLALEVHATRCPQSSGRHSGRCTVGKPTGVFVPGEAIETHQGERCGTMTVE